MAESAPLSPEQLSTITARTLGHYDGSADSFRTATWDHDVAQNYDAILTAIAANPASKAPYRILDFGCGPGRDLVWFKSHGHTPTGLDGAANFVEMARAASGCEVLQQSFLALDLPPARFDGIFANATMFHVPTQELPRVLGQLHDALIPGGVLFCSNPRGTDSEGWSGERYGAYHTLEAWSAIVTRAGFTLVDHYYRPAGKPRAEQPWLATVWRR
jgi:SAM-dependent methyltransferase